MKTLLLLVVLVGVAAARPNRDQVAKLAGLLQRMLEENKKQGPPPPPNGGPGPGPSSGSGMGPGSGYGSGMGYGEGFDFPPPGMEMESTLLDGLGPEFKPFKLFGGFVHIDFETPLDVSKEQFDQFRDAVKNAADAISGIGGRLVEAIDDFQANAPSDLTYVGLADGVVEKLEPILYSDEDANIEEIAGMTCVALMQGAVAGTQGGPVDEPGCHFKEDNGQDVKECLLNKLFLLQFAVETSIEMAMFEMEFESDENGRTLVPCDDLYSYLVEANEYSPEALLAAFQRTISCIRGNIEHIRDRIGMRAADNSLPSDKPKLPLPLMIASQAFLHHVTAQSFLAVDMLYEVMFIAYDLANEAGEFEYDEEERRHLKQKKAFAQRKVAGSLYLSHSAKAFTRSKLPSHHAKKAKLGLH